MQCRDAIDARLSFGGEWDGGLPAFSKYWWVGSDHEVIAFSGSNLQAKNAYGLTIKTPFICEFNVTSQSIERAAVLTP